jgi:hypothetical protein
MQLTDLTSYDAIRGALGLSSDEIDDSVLGADYLLFSVKAELRAVSALVAYMFIMEKAEEERTDAEQELFEAVQLYVPYVVGMQLRSTLPLGAPKQIGDGKAVLARDAGAPFALTMQVLNAEYARLKVLVQNAVTTFNGETVTQAKPQMYVAAGVPSYDPVTG